jgi:hypothetical protein
MSAAQPENEGVNLIMADPLFLNYNSLRLAQLVPQSELLQ